MNKCLAAIVAISLVMSAPGTQAWGQVASSVRPVPPGYGLYGKWSTGPGSDLEAATRVARAMVQLLGMSEEMGLAQTAPNQYGQSAFGGEADSRALLEVNKIMKASMVRTETRLRAGAVKHNAMIEALMAKETLSADDIEAIAHPEAK